ncbi:MAG: hypothetical protein K9J37_02545 [Saprospiraceae bacterium]|nr:hypothetical protein [Saprospiraceae bacterium]MCF8248759.1 hypothetical protein [Saprospiraceae bacterium]MCF8278751.1 hypothetical protein [Bacteroidales bacterium]MCF8310551.1 hypothetical protein [Saprospiraceae bacterium]MCF8439110.1 hypothetical protein [Saprospiraceae bacterium]
MQKIAFILAIQFAVFSTQPLWQPLAQAMFGSCGSETCGLTAMSCAASPTLPDSPSKDADGKTPDSCCVPFQCCFPCCCYCQQTAQFSDFAEGETNTRPNETTKVLHSAHVGEHFQPRSLRSTANQPGGMPWRFECSCFW